MISASLIIEVAVLKPEGAATSNQLRGLLREKFYSADVVARESGLAAGKLGALFQYFLSHPDDLPTSYKEQVEAEPTPSGGLRLPRGYD